MRRPEVVAYRRWADDAWIALNLELAGPDLDRQRPRHSPSRVEATAFFRIPLSWSARKRAEHAGLPHRLKPDVDNVGKALLDALFEKDEVVHELSVTKRWDDGQGPRLQVLVEFDGES